MKMMLLQMASMTVLQLSSKPLPTILSSSSHLSMGEGKEYQNIIKIVKNSPQIPSLSRGTVVEILRYLKSSVNDLFSVTTAHYIYAGDAGIDHLLFLMNAAISDLNNLALDDLSMVWACVLHKGHGKDRAHAKNYRTISTCPIVSKAIDAYISLLYSNLWNDATADTQFQCQESSHELAALALTESINFSIASNSKPAYVIYLDAKNAFNLVLRETLITDLYEIGIKDQGLVLIDERLKNRKTVCEWDRILMGPIRDDCGVEQGGINSSEYYKV